MLAAFNFYLPDTSNFPGSDTHYSSPVLVFNTNSFKTKNLRMEGDTILVHYLEATVCYSNCLFSYRCEGIDHCHQSGPCELVSVNQLALGHKGSRGLGGSEFSFGKPLCVYVRVVCCVHLHVCMEARG